MKSVVAGCVRPGVLCIVHSLFCEIQVLTACEVAGRAVPGLGRDRVEKRRHVGVAFEVGLQNNLRRVKFTAVLTVSFPFRSSAVSCEIQASQYPVLDVLRFLFSGAARSLMRLIKSSSPASPAHSRDKHLACSCVRHRVLQGGGRT